MTKSIYLDNNTIAKPSMQALSKMMPYLSDFWGAPSAPHKKGQELFPAIEENYKKIYSLLGASDRDDFILTSSGAEAVNHVFFSVYFHISRGSGKNQFITSNIDEAPALMSIGRLEQLSCIGIMVDANNNGIVTPEAIAKAITPRTALVSISWANALTGVINPVAEIATMCREKGIFFHVDATQVLGKLLFNMSEIKADFITFNGDQLHAPKGIGGLLIRNGVHCSPFIVGGSEQGGFRAGSLNVPGLVALGHIADENIETRDLMCTEVARLRGKLESGIVAKYTQAKVLLDGCERLPHCTVIAFPGVINEALLYELNRKGVCATIGGGCFQQIALILEGCGIPTQLAHSSISFSLSRETTEDEIDQAIDIVANAASKLSRLSAFT